MSFVNELNWTGKIIFHRDAPSDGTNRTYPSVTMQIDERAGLGEVLQAFQKFSLACGWDQEQWVKCLEENLAGKEPVG